MSYFPKDLRLLRFINDNNLTAFTFLWHFKCQYSDSYRTTTVIKLLCQVFNVVY